MSWWKQMDYAGFVFFFVLFLSRADEINFHSPCLPIARKHSLNWDVGEAFGTARPQNSQAQNHTSWIKLVVISSHSFFFFFFFLAVFSQWLKLEQAQGKRNCTARLWTRMVINRRKKQTMLTVAGRWGYPAAFCRQKTSELSLIALFFSVHIQSRPVTVL